jgi:glutamyl/glutaminyl-tRNA synthetase
MNTAQTRLTKLIKNIAQDFSLAKLSKSPARFDLQKLTWFNRQFIQMMSLDEFVTRAFELKLGAKSKDMKLRVGDYVYLVDLKTQKTLVKILPEKEISTDSFIYHQMGGGREDDESSLESLIREVKEESDGKIIIDPNNLIKLISHEIIFPEQDLLSNPNNNERELYDGKEHNLYFYNLDSDKFDGLVNSEGEIFEWRNLNVVLNENRFITYPVWKQFCKKQNLALAEPNDAILRQYLAWQLDKNRVNLLTEIGSESDCITNWQKPTKEEVSWKKITKEESLQNLAEIKNVIEKSYNDINLNIKSKQDLLYSKVKNEIFLETEKEIEKSLSEMTSTWENLLKNWVSENSKDAGSYFWPLRVALSGKQKSPSPFEILSILSHNEVLNRIDQVLKN